MLRLALILALLASIGSLVVSFTITKPKVDAVVLKLDETSKDLTQTKTDLAAKKKEASEAKATAEKVTKELGETKTALETATTEATTEKSRADKLQNDLSKTVKERNDAQVSLAQWNSLNIQPDKVKVLQADLKKANEERDALVDEKQVFLRNISQLKNKLNRIIGEDTKVQLPPGLSGNVIAVGPQQDFVLLDIGADKGVLERGEMMVRRGDKLVGKVRIVTVEPGRCVANILTDWRQGDLAVVEGDKVLY